MSSSPMMSLGSLLAFVAAVLVFYRSSVATAGGPSEPADERLRAIRDVCQRSQSTVAAAVPYGLPEVVAVNWGQADGPYSLPPERLVVCADGKAFLWTKVHAASPTSTMAELTMPQKERLFETLLSAWPQGVAVRGTEDSNFIWVLDSDDNLIVSPTVQERRPGAGNVDIKHGDLCPGIDLCGSNGVEGQFRGVARMGGEFNLAGNRDGNEWVMHTKSGYCGSRVPVEKAARFYREMRDQGKNDADIGRNFEACVMKDLFLARVPLRRVFNYMRGQLSVEAKPGSTMRCDITNKSVPVPGHGGLPDLAACDPREPGDELSCKSVEASGVASDAPVVHLVHWIAPGQADPCQLASADFDSAFQTIKASADESATPETMKRLKNETKFLRKHACFSEERFMAKLRCNIHGCFGEGLTQRLKAAEDAFAAAAAVSGSGGDDDTLRLHEAAKVTWSHFMEMWASCLMPPSAPRASATLDL